MAKNKKKKKKQSSNGQQYLSAEQYIRQKARTLEIGRCYMSDRIETIGEGYVIVSRNHTGGNITMACYLIDTNCLGVKDSFYHFRISEEEFDEIVYTTGARECSYDEAHNMVYGSIEYAEEAGIAPDKSFNLTQYILKEDTDDIPLIEYEYGMEGKHTLIAHNHLEASKYLPLLKENLGDGNYTYIINDSHDTFDDDDTYGDDYHPIFKTYGPDVMYSYQHPRYPTSVTLHHPWLEEELEKTENATYIRNELLERILALPKEELRQDLEQTIMRHIGITCDGIPDDYGDGQYNGTLATALMLIAEIGNDTSSLDAVLETMRQSDDFLEYHFGDSSYETFVPTLYKLGQHRLDKLMSFVKEEGLCSFAKANIFPAVVQIALRQPGRRTEVVEWFRKVLAFAAEHIAAARSFDSNLAGLLICDVIDLHEISLQPELKSLFNTGLVDIGVCGRYESVMQDITDPDYTSRTEDCILDIHERFADMRRRFDR